MGKAWETAEAMSLLDFKRSVAIGLLTLGLNYGFGNPRQLDLK
jgi:hypothetical protein